MQIKYWVNYTDVKNLLAFAKRATVSLQKVAVGEGPYSTEWRRRTDLLRQNAAMDRTATTSQAFTTLKYGNVEYCVLI